VTYLKAVSGRTAQASGQSGRVSEGFSVRAYAYRRPLWRWPGMHKGGE
jgi:hypothetical protein